MDTPSFFQRWILSWTCAFRTLFDGAFARRVAELSHPALPEGSPVPTERKSGPLREQAGQTSAPELRAQWEHAGALKLLSLLQREGRFVDFVEGDLSPYSDGEVGAVARAVHEGCRGVLRAHAPVEPVRREDEGVRVTLSEGFSADEVKLVGNLSGKPPFVGTLRHRGWRAKECLLPVSVGESVNFVVAPAEVEL